MANQKNAFLLINRSRESGTRAKHGRRWFAVVAGAAIAGFVVVTLTKTPAPEPVAVGVFLEEHQQAISESLWRYEGP